MALPGLRAPTYRLDPSPKWMPASHCSQGNPLLQVGSTLAGQSVNSHPHPLVRGARLNTLFLQVRNLRLQDRMQELGADEWDAPWEGERIVV